MKIIKNSLLWLPAILWYRIIWGFSAQTAEVSGSLSDRLLWRLMALLSPSFAAADFETQNAAIELLSFFERKAAHMFLYFVLILLLLLALLPLIRRKRTLAILSTTLCAALAALDEYHQLLVPGRSGQLRDVCIDLTGAAAALLLIGILLWSNRERTQSRRLTAWLPVCIPLLPAVLLAVLPTPFGTLPSFFGAVQQFVPGFTALSGAGQSILLAALSPIFREFCFLAICGVLGACAALSALHMGMRPIRTVLCALVLAALLSGMLSLLLDPAIAAAAMALALLGCVLCLIFWLLCRAARYLALPAERR